MNNEFWATEYVKRASMVGGLSPHEQNLATIKSAPLGRVLGAGAVLGAPIGAGIGALMGHGKRKTVDENGNVVEEGGTRLRNAAIGLGMGAGLGAGGAAAFRHAIPMPAAQTNANYMTNAVNG
jgi:hypothetical protein